MVVWCTQKFRRNGSSFTWHQPCGHTQRALASTPPRWRLKIRAIKGYTTVTHSASHATYMCAVSLLESREQRYIKANNNNYYYDDDDYYYYSVVAEDIDEHCL